MGTWMKETDQAIYLMQDNQYIASVVKRPSQTNPMEQVVDIKTFKAWFTHDDKPRRMTVSVGTGEPEPEPAITDPTWPGLPEIPGGGHGPEGGQPDTNSPKIRVISDTYFKLSPKMSGELSDSQKVLVKKGSVFNIEYYTDVGNNHWLVELLEPSIGDQKTTGWYVYTPDVKPLSDITLTVTTDTYFKLEPKQSSELPSTSKVFVKKSTQLKIMSHLPAANKHTEIELADAILDSNQETTWYAYTPDIKIGGNQQTLATMGDTVFKSSTAMAAELPDDEKVFVKGKTVFWVSSYGQPEKSYVKVAFQGAYLGPKNRNTWYCFVPDIQISGTEIGNNPDDNNSSSSQPTNPADRGMPLQLPGFSGVYYSNDPIYWETQYGERGHFTWGEAVHADPSTGYYRRPENSGVVNGILNVAKVMEDIRKRYGGVPIQINSWYRDPATNAAVGGASQSRHMSGDAVDFVVPGIHPYDVYADLDAWWGNRGGLASSTVFTHIDTRGYHARWDYGY